MIRNAGEDDDADAKLPCHGTTKRLHATTRSGTIGSRQKSRLQVRDIISFIIIIIIIVIDYPLRFVIGSIPFDFQASFVSFVGSFVRTLRTSDSIRRIAQFREFQHGHSSIRATSGTG